MGRQRLLRQKKQGLEELISVMSTFQMFPKRPYCRQSQVLEIHW